MSVWRCSAACRVEFKATQGHHPAMAQSVTLSDELLTIVDDWREGTGLGRSAAVEFLLRAYLGTTQESPLATTSAADPVVGNDASWDEPDVTEADAPDDAEEATGSSTPASSGDTP